MLKQAQSIGPKMEALTQELKSKRVSGAAGGGMVTVHADGLGTVISVEVDPMLTEKGDVEMVKDLLPAAINDAMAKAKMLHVESMQSITGGLPIPGNMEQMFQQMSGQLGDLDLGEFDDEKGDQDPR